MSWAASEWKDGLPARALQKISEYEKQAERMKKEINQKEVQLDRLNQVRVVLNYWYMCLLFFVGWGEAGLGSGIENRSQQFLDEAQKLHDKG